MRLAVGSFHIAATTIEVELTDVPSCCLRRYVHPETLSTCSVVLETIPSFRLNLMRDDTWRLCLH